MSNKIETLNIVRIDNGITLGVDETVVLPLINPDKKAPVLHYLLGNGYSEDVSEDKEFLSNSSKFSACCAIFDLPCCRGVVRARICIRHCGYYRWTYRCGNCFHRVVISCC